MNEVFSSALELQSFCREQGWKFCFIGGIAVQRWGEPRFTDDVDITLMTGFGGEERFLELLLERFHPRRSNAAEFALKNRVLLLQDSNGVPLDVALGAVPFEMRSVERASPFLFPPAQSLITCSAEDLITHKCFAGRDQDWLDVAGILARQVGKLEFALVRKELAPLLELNEKPENLARLEVLVKRYKLPRQIMTNNPRGRKS